MPSKRVFLRRAEDPFSPSDDEDSEEVEEEEIESNKCPFSSDVGEEAASGLTLSRELFLKVYKIGPLQIRLRTRISKRQFPPRFSQFPAYRILDLKDENIIILCV